MSMEYIRKTYGVPAKTDIVERLRDLRERFIFQGSSQFACDLADEITRLRTERDNLRAEQKQCEDCDPVGKAAEIERLRAAIETMDRKAQAGLCYFTLASARAFLQDVRDEAAKALKGGA
jgi:hypothetical protein